MGIAKVNLYNRTTKSINETAVNMVVGGYTNEFAYTTILALHLLATVVVTTLSYFRYKRNNTKQYFKMNKRAVCMQYGISMMFLFVFLFEILAYSMINSHEEVSGLSYSSHMSLYFVPIFTYVAFCVVINLFQTSAQAMGLMVVLRSQP